jgi:hypothetical protein
MRRDRIDKKSADPVLLRIYKNMRNSRRYEEVLPVIMNIARIAFFASIAVVLLFNVTGTAVLVIVIGTGIIALLSFIIPAVMWAPEGKRWLTVLIIVCFLAFCALLAYLPSFL